MNNQSFFLLFTNCIPVKGANQSLIYDLQQSRYKQIPNLLYDILKHTKIKNIGEIKDFYNNQYDKGIDRYLNLLESESFGFFCNDISCFPELSLDWDYPGEITNAIIDLDTTSTYDVSGVLKELDQLNCQAVQFRFFYCIDTVKLENLLRLIDDYRFRSIEFMLPFNELYTATILENLKAVNKRLRSVIFTNCKDDLESYVIENMTVHAINTNISELSNPRVHTKNSFRVNIKLFTESQLNNNFFNRKICISRIGQIKNYTSLDESFGTVGDIKLRDAINQQDFRRLWYLTKDSIKGCQDCEFRYMCTGYAKYEESTLTDLIRCNYNPYTSTWN